MKILISTLISVSATFALAQDPVDFTETAPISPAAEENSAVGNGIEGQGYAVIQLGVGVNVISHNTNTEATPDIDTVRLLLPAGGTIDSFILTEYNTTSNTGMSWNIFDSSDTQILDTAMDVAGFDSDVGLDLLYEVVGTGIGLDAGPAFSEPYSEDYLTFQTVEGNGDGNDWTYTITVSAGGGDYPPIDFTETVPISPAAEEDSAVGNGVEGQGYAVLQLGFGENTVSHNTNTEATPDNDTVRLLLPPGGTIESFILTEYNTVSNTGMSWNIFDSSDTQVLDGAMDVAGTDSDVGLDLLYEAVGEFIGRTDPPAFSEPYSEDYLTFQTIEGNGDGNDWTYTITVVGEGEGPEFWYGNLVDEMGWADTGSWLGQVWVEHDPWVYSLSLEAYIYVSDDSGWIYTIQ